MSQRVSTEHLIEGASKSDEPSMDELISRFLPELNAYLRLRMGRGISLRESPSDLAQSVCREVLQDIGDFRYSGDTAFKRWLFLQAQRKLSSKGRFHAQQRRAADREQPMGQGDFAEAAVDLLTPSRDAMAKEELELFARSVEQLPEEQRTAITLCRGLGMTSVEAAAELGKSANAVRISLHRGLARLAALQEP